MGVMFSALLNYLFGQKEERILVLGLDNAGKTTILYRLQLNETIKTTPTIGFNVETVTYNNLTFQMWDLGGQTSIRPYWRSYFPNTNAIVFVVDCADRDRICIADTELKAILNEDELRDACLLVFANKQDVRGSLKAPQLSEALHLSEIRNRRWTIVESDARRGVGVKEGFNWLSQQFNSM